jgi:hypothetical protein
MTLRIGGKRPTSRALIVSAIVAFAIGPTAMLAYTARGGEPSELVVWLMAGGGFGAMALMMAAYVPRKATLCVEEIEEPSPTGAPFRTGPAALVTPSWRASIRPALERVRLGPWMQPGVGASQGVFVEVAGERGSVVVGAKGHTGEGYVLSAPPRRGVEFETTSPELGALLDAIGVAPGRAAPLMIDCMTNRMSFAATARWIASSVAAMVIASMVGFAGSNAGFAEGGIGKFASGALPPLIVVGVLGYNVYVALRAGSPALRISVESSGLTLLGRDGAVLSRTPWQFVKALRLVYEVSTRGSSYPIPVLALTLGDAKPIQLGAWDPQLAWDDESITSHWTAPAFLVGTPIWPRLVAVLEEHARLT